MNGESSTGVEARISRALYYTLEVVESKVESSTVRLELKTISSFWVFVEPTE